LLQRLRLQGLKLNFNPYIKVEAEEGQCSSAKHQCSIAEVPIMVEGSIRRCSAAKEAGSALHCSAIKADFADLTVGEVEARCSAVKAGFTNFTTSFQPYSSPN
jgi:hypothetical protein